MLEPNFGKLTGVRLKLKEVVENALGAGVAVCAKLATAKTTSTAISFADFTVFPPNR
jgi:hypothetical protein